MKFSTDAFISYSANYEDVYLNRLFAKQSLGFYVDVGAAHPFFENDTKALYDRGWSGINIEPSPEFFDTLAAERPRDLNLRLLVSKETGMQTFFQIPGTGLSTADHEEAERARGKGFEIVETTVGAETLARILEKSSPLSIDLLKVDVEGFELNVLQSNDWLRFRPKVLLIEATFPETSVRRPDNIGPYLSSVGYRHVFFDGLNDYYLEERFQVGSDTFDRPVNIFDNFIQFSYIQLQTSFRAAMQQQAADTKLLRRQAHLIEAQTADLMRSKAELQASILRTSEFAAQLDATLSRVTQMQIEQEALIRHRDEVNILRQEANILRQSTSWRVTLPLRAIRKPRRTLLMLLRIVRTRLR